MSVHKGITSLEEFSKAASKGTTDLRGDHRFGPAHSLAWLTPHVAFKAPEQNLGCGLEGGVGNQKEFDEDPDCGLGAPDVGSEGNELTCGG